MSIAEETYLAQRGKLMDYERSLSAKPDEARKAVEDQAGSSRRTVLPKIKLSEFSGKYEDYPAFRDHFVSTIDSNKQLPTVEKLHYLRSCVQREAASLIQNLPAIKASYKKAWRELTDFYQNTRLLTRSYLSKFLSLQKMKNDSAVDLKQNFYTTVNIHDALENLERPVSSSKDLFVHIIFDLLGPRTRDL
ncbi:uncharacterized protein LOC109862750 [Pseudomyrmex gracilis]|uniref:uncharacterized protein LOC109862750 n=1 Tax=Pseudomyrmex gracilis TaxID=219809 RepID=UPI0009954C02|nr:uncharacterized protein LOC109862750 [Pseudomyrmex gracilis]